LEKPKISIFSSYAYNFLGIYVAYYAFVTDFQTRSVWLITLVVESKCSFVQTGIVGYHHSAVAGCDGLEYIQ